MADIYSFEDYLKAKREKADAHLIGIIERFLTAHVLSDLPGFMSEFAHMRERLHLIEEANRRQFPLPDWRNPPEPRMIDDIRIPLTEYERLQRLTDTINRTATHN